MNQDFPQEIPWDTLDGREPLDPELTSKVEARLEESLDGIEVRNPSTWADESVALEHALRRMKLTGTPTHVITFTVFTGTPEDWDEVYNALDRIVRKLGPNQMRVALMSSLVEEEVDQGLSEDYALDTLRSILYDEGLSKQSVNDAVNRLLRSGVVLTTHDESKETHTEDTLFKVKAALESYGAYGLQENTAIELINAMQNAGILFRERREFVETGDDGHSRVRVEPQEKMGDALYIHNKVWNSLKEAGITGSLLERCIETMSNNGIVFRERSQ